MGYISKRLVKVILARNQLMVGLLFQKEAKLLCRKIVNFFSLLSKTYEIGVRRLGITQELLSLVTGLAHYLKILIRLALTASLRLVRTISFSANRRNKITMMQPPLIFSSIL